MENADLLIRINQHYASFSKGQKLLANYIMENYDKAAFITAARMGHTVGVSESTVVRFAYALGYQGYPAMQEVLRERVRSSLTSVQRIRLAADIPLKDVQRAAFTADMNNIRATMETLDGEAFMKAISMLLSARRIYVLGMRSAAALAQFFAYYLDYVCPDVLLVNGTQDAHERMLRIDAGDVCFGISFPRYSARTAEAMQYAKARGARLIALTDQKSSPAAAGADCVLLAHSDMASFADSLTAPLSMLNAIIMAVGLKRRDAAMSHLTQLEKVWESDRVYVPDLDTPGGGEKQG